jgi:hypothetical protein
MPDEKAETKETTEEKKAAAEQTDQKSSGPTAESKSQEAEPPQPLNTAHSDLEGEDRYEVDSWKGLPHYKCLATDAKGRPCRFDTMRLVPSFEAHWQAAHIAPPPPPGQLPKDFVVAKR